MGRVYKNSPVRSPNTDNTNNAYYVNSDGNVNNNNNWNDDNVTNSYGRRPALMNKTKTSPSNIFIRYESSVYLLKETLSSRLFL